MDRGQDRRLDQPAVGEWEEVEAVVDEVELISPFEDGGDVKTLLDLGIQGGILGVSRGSGAHQPSAGHRVRGGEEGDVHTLPDQPFGEQRHELLPWPVMARGNPPRDRSQDRDLQQAATGIGRE